MLENRLALVTGASRGIGKAIALMLGRQGATVVGSATSTVGADSITAYLNAAGIKGKGIVLDVSAQASIDTAAEILKTDFQQMPTILVNNAGITRDNIMLRMKDAEWDDVLATNLTGPYRVIRTCLKGMLKAKAGRIINIGSVVGIMGAAGQANYSAAKAGLVGLTKSLAKELASRQITVNLIAPGFIASDMTDVLSEQQREAILAQVPLGSLGQPEDVASAVGFLASDAGRYITGEVLNVNGGLYI